PRKRHSPPRRRRKRTSSRSWSPGATGRRNFAPSTPTIWISTSRGSFDSLRSHTPAAWARLSMISTPGITGSPGKWPAKKSSEPVTFFVATSPSFGSCSSTRSSSTNGYWLGIRRTSDAMSIALMGYAGAAARTLSARAAASACERLRLGGSRARLGRRGGRGLGRGGRRLGGLLRVVRLHDHVPRDVEVAGHRERHLRVPDDGALLGLGHGLDVGLDLARDLVVQGLGRALAPLAHALQLRLPVLQEGLPLAGLLHDLAPLLLRGLRAQDRALLVELVLQGLDRVVD